MGIPRDRISGLESRDAPAPVWLDRGLPRDRPPSSVFGLQAAVGELVPELAPEKFIRGDALLRDLRSAVCGPPSSIVRRPSAVG